MKEEKTTPLRQRMIEDMRIRGLGAKTQRAHIRSVKHFAGFLGRSPDTATPDDLRAYQLDMTNAGVSATTFNVRIISLRFLIGVTLGARSVKKMLSFSVPPGYRRSAPVKRPKLDGFTEIIDQWLREDLGQRAKQRHTAKRVFERRRASTASPAATPS